jgi:hypothetical protein
MSTTVKWHRFVSNNKKNRHIDVTITEMVWNIFKGNDQLKEVCKDETLVLV